MSEKEMGRKSQPFSNSALYQPPSRKKCITKKCISIPVSYYIRCGQHLIQILQQPWERQDTL